MHENVRRGPGIMQAEPRNASTSLSLGTYARAKHLDEIQA
jgi:hypothetical protein